MEETDHDLLVRIDERLKGLDTYKAQTKEMWTVYVFGRWLIAALTVAVIAQSIAYLYEVIN